MKIIVTGASGFMGTHLISALCDAGHKVTATSRTRIDMPDIQWVGSPELGPEADWSKPLAGAQAVVHLAGRVHATSGKLDSKTDEMYFRINRDGTRALAQQAVEAGIQHFVFLSSCHAVAAESDQALDAESMPQPVSTYGKSKLSAELAIQEELSETPCGWTIFRPPLVYGSGNKANFALLLKSVKTGIPLPLASVRNRRSFIYVENMVDLIKICLGNPKAYGKTYFPSDGEDVSTPELLAKIAKANASIRQDANKTLGETSACNSTRHSPLVTRHSPRLFPFPETALKAIARLPGLGALRKLTSSLYVDSEPIQRELGWRPPFTMDESLRRTIAKRS